MAVEDERVCPHGGVDVRVALVTEGTYPYSHGGVSVWCDQLVRGLSEHEFSIVAITGAGGGSPAWELPPNVTEVLSVPLWGRLPRPRRTPERDGRPHRAGGSARADRAARASGRDAARHLVLALLDPDLDRARRGFAEALRGWALCPDPTLAERQLVSAALVGELLERWDSRALAEHWGGVLRHGRPTVGDAVTASRLIAHNLRPLAAPLPAVDLCHPVSNGIAGLVAVATRWRDGTPFVLSEHGVYLRERYLSFRAGHSSWPVKWLLMRFYRLLTSVVYAEASLVAPGNSYNRRWERQDGVPDDAIRTVYNGVDPDEFAARVEQVGDPTVVWVGRVDPLKDLATLIRAFALVVAECPTARLRLFGGTPRGNEGYQEEMAALAQQLGVADSVTFEGRVEVIQEAYAAGRVVALTSISEGFPYTVIEAMSCARATVSTDVGGVAEAVGDAGLVVPPRDPAAFARACLTLLTDPPLADRLAALARQRVLELFTLERSIAAFRAIYGDVHTDVADGQPTGGRA
jgi:glycosyltransferase involved in cell wall biosynthesis